MSGLSRLLARLRGLTIDRARAAAVFQSYHRPRPTLPSAPPAQSVPPPPAAVPRRPRGNVNTVRYFREAILDELGYYVKIATRIKRADPDAYDLYSRLGAHLVDHVWFTRWDESRPVSRWWRQTRPSFGAIAFGTSSLDEEDNKEDRYSPRFVYFQKYEKGHVPPGVERPFETGSHYSLTLYFHRPDRKTGFPLTLHFFVAADGTVRPLRVLFADARQVQNRRGWFNGKNRSYGLQKITTHRWGLPPILLDWAQDQTERWGLTEGLVDPAGYAVSVFLTAVRTWESVNLSTIRVEIHKPPIVALIGIDLLRTPYFFKDRDVVLNEAGNRRKIFHIVRTFRRADGKVVKTHFRGEREFKWNGYFVKITVPGRDHFPLGEFNLGVADVATLEPAVKTVGMAAFADLIRDDMEQGLQ
jgi:hypothetical protein